MPAAIRTDRDFDGLRRSVEGALLVPGDDGYDAARAVWNGMFEPRPAAIVRCRSSADVVAAVKFARERGFRLSVSGNGHSYAGHSMGDGALAIDLSLMNDVRVDADARRAVVGPGATWAALDAATQAHGLATTGGTVSTVGVSGFILGGGTGYLARRYGLGSDNLLAAQVVTADGRVVRASADENADLLWALRGGSGNFGVVAQLELQLHEVGPEIVMVQAFHPFEDAATVLRFYRDFMEAAPDEVNVYAFVLRTPPVEPFPEAQQGRPCLALVGCHCGLRDEGQAVLRPMAEFGRPFLAALQTIPYTAAQQAFDAGMPKGLRWYSRSDYLPELNDDVVETVVRFTAELPGPFTMVYFEYGGGAVSRVAPDATAFPHRGAEYSMQIFPGWTDPQDDAGHIDWARRFHDALSPHCTGAVYVNMLSHDEPQRVPAAYGRNYERLVTLKKVWDPDNLFSVNHNIPPETRGGNLPR